MAYAMVGLADTGLGLLGDLQTIVNVDINFPLFLSYFGVGASNVLMPAQLGSPAFWDTVVWVWVFSAKF